MSAMLPLDCSRSEQCLSPADHAVVNVRRAYRSSISIQCCGLQDLSPGGGLSMPVASNPDGTTSRSRRLLKILVLASEFAVVGAL